jgi:hypothetical protein
MAKGITVTSSVWLLLGSGLVSGFFLYALSIGQRGLFSGAVGLLLHEGKVLVERLGTLRATFGKGGGGGQGHQAGKYQGREFHGSVSGKCDRYPLCP